MALWECSIGECARLQTTFFWYWICNQINAVLARLCHEPWKKFRIAKLYLSLSPMWVRLGLSLCSKDHLFVYLAPSCQQGTKREKTDQYAKQHLLSSCGNQTALNAGFLRYGWGWCFLVTLRLRLRNQCLKVTKKLQKCSQKASSSASTSNLNFTSGTLP